VKPQLGPAKRESERMPAMATVMATATAVLGDAGDVLLMPRTNPKLAETQNLNSAPVPRKVEQAAVMASRRRTGGGCGVANGWYWCFTERKAAAA